MEKILIKQSFPQWVTRLSSYEIFAPVKTEAHWNYQVVKDPAGLDLNHPNTVLSPKKIIFPLREVFFEFNTQNEEAHQVKEILPGEQAAVIFGVRPCDARALTLTDKVFSGDFEDPYYWKRRNSTTLVGLACSSPPSENCFCLSLAGSPFSTAGLDMLLVDLGRHYFLESLTEKGDQLINLGADLFADANGEHRQGVEKARENSEKQIARQIKDTQKIPPKLKDMFDSPLWDEESLSCIRCGICTYLCPTCHCFDINDEVSSNSPLHGKRIRTWDNCQFPDFTMHSSGHNPRPNKASRLRQRILHKYQYFVDRYEEYQCTGCGRCVSKCPVGIDIIEILNKVSDYGT